MISNIPKTIFCEIDGVILFEKTSELTCLDGVLEQFASWKELEYKVVLTTNRDESKREETEEVLKNIGIQYHTLVMGLTDGDRVVINAKKERGVENTAFAINLPHNWGMEEMDLKSSKVTIPERFLFEKVEKPWGYEELVECNDKYVVKKLFMKAGHSCSTQYHRLKRETMIILTGKLWMAVGPDMDHLQEKIYEFGETITVDPYTVHKMRAIEDCLFLEGSTNELWDVVRLEDSYGRVPMVTDK